MLANHESNRKQNSNKGSPGPMNLVKLIDIKLLPEKVANYSDSNQYWPNDLRDP